MPFCQRESRRQRTPKGDYWRSVHGYPENPQTVGEWVRKRRLDLGLEQAQVAAKLGVHVESVKNWERGVLKPAVAVMPRVIGFLGANPLPKPTSFAEWLVFYRTSHGLRQGDLAKLVEVDPATIGRWEAGFIPTPLRVTEVKRCLRERCESGF